MGLGEHRPASVGEAFDDVGLPQRSAAIHPATDDTCHLVGQLVGTARRGEADVAHVVVEVEVGVVDPVRVVEFERHLDQPAAHRLEPPDEGVESVVSGLERIEVAVRPLVDGEPADVSVGIGRLHVEETRIEAGQLFHVRSLAPACRQRHCGAASRRHSWSVYVRS